MLSRKSQLADVFPYIFVIVAGAMILAFFAFFGFRMINTSESLISIEVINSIDDSLSAFGVAMNTNTYLPDRPWPRDVRLRVTCSGFGADDFETSLPTAKPIFSPLKLRGRQIQAWTKTWKLPFKITNFFYLSNQLTHYILVGNGLGDLVIPEKGGIPRRFSIEIKPNVDNNVIRNFAQGKEFVKVVFFNKAPTVTETEKIRVIRIDTQDFEQGVVKFSKGELPFFTKEMLFGAIFTDNIDTYKCNVKKSNSYFSAMIQLYIEKIQLLSIKFPECDYNPLRSNLQNMKSILQGDTIDTNSLLATSENLFDLNQDLLGDQRCKHVF